MDLREAIPDQGARKKHRYYDVDKCPFHDDKKPSLLIYEKGWKCMAGCGSGNAADFFSRLGISVPHCERKPVIVPARPKEEMPQPLGLEYHLAMKDKEREWYKYRGLTDATIDRFQLGYGTPPGNGSGRFTIPVYEGERLVNVRFRLDDRCPCGSCFTDNYYCWECGQRYEPRDQKGKYIGIAGHNEPRLFNVRKISTKRIIIAEGEFDTMILVQNGYNAVCGTGGASVFPDEWARYFLEYPYVYVVYDCDKAGIDSAKMIAEKIPKARIVTLPLGDKGDVSDYFTNHTKEEFDKLLERTDRMNNVELKLENIGGYKYV